MTAPEMFGGLAVVALAGVALLLLSLTLEMLDEAGRAKGAARLMYVAIALIAWPAALAAVAGAVMLAT